MIDTDKSGGITKSELKHAFEMNSKKDDKLWTAIMKEVDKDGDGGITFEEFKLAMNQVVSTNYKEVHTVRNCVKFKF